MIERVADDADHVVGLAPAAWPADAICVGLVCSVSMKYLIGWPLMPPLAFTQVK